MKTYEYVNVKVSRAFGAGSLEHRAVIDRYAAMGYRYVGFVPTSIAEHGKYKELDLIFERDL